MAAVTYTDPSNQVVYTLFDTTAEVSRSQHASGAVILPSSITYNGKTYAVTSIGVTAFYNCTSLTSVMIPEGVTSIGIAAFSQCSGLTSVTIPNGVTSIGGFAFNKCSALKSVSIPSTIPSIGRYAFTYCGALSSIKIPEGVTVIEQGAFENCDALISVTLPNSLTTIAQEAFRYCRILQKVVIPNRVTTIGNLAFIGCNKLTSIVIPNNITIINFGAFAYCTSLTNATLPSSVTSISYGAFDGCSNLRKIYCLGTPPAAESDSFRSLPNAAIFYYYKGTAGWKTNYRGFPIVAMDTTSPKVSSPTSASVFVTTATLGGCVTDEGGLSITARGIVFAKTADNPVPRLNGTNVTQVTSVGTAGVFTVKTTGLIPGTQYCYAAYATNSKGTSYTDVVGAFTTGVRIPVGTIPLLKPAAPMSCGFYFPATVNFQPFCAHFCATVQ